MDGIRVESRATIQNEPDLRELVKIFVKLPVDRIDVEIQHFSIQEMRRHLDNEIEISLIFERRQEAP